MRPALAVFVGALVLFLANGREVTSKDTLPARYVPIQVLHGSLDLSSVPFFTCSPKDYYLIEHGHRLYSMYPIAAGIAATPIFAVPYWLGWIRTDADVDFYAKLSAAILVAAGAAALARARMPHALLAAVLFACATPAWSSASQGLWTHALATPAFCAMLTLASRDRLAGAGFFAGLAVAARPQLAPAAALFGVVGIADSGWPLTRFAAAAMLPAAAGVLLNIVQFGSPLGGYSDVAAVGGPVWMGIAGLLVSPSRGLLFFAPWLVLAVATSVRPSSPWHRASAAAALAIVLVHALFPHWWGGWSYGPRYLADAAPFLSMLAAPPLVALWQARVARPAGPALAAALVATSVAVQAIGAFYYRDEIWNRLPADVDNYPERCFELSGSQIPVTLAAGLAPRGFRGHEASSCIGHARLREGDLDQAEFYARQGISVNPNSAPSHALLGEIAWRRGRRAEARHEFEEALRNDPSYTIARVALQQLGAE